MRLYRRENGFWYVRFKRGHTKSLGTKDKRIAERLFREIEKEVLKGKLIEIEKQYRVTLKDFFDEFISWSALRKSPSTIDREYYVFRRFMDYFGNQRVLQSITTKELEEYQCFLSTTRKATGINIDFRHLKAAFNKAVEWSYLKSNPFCKIKAYKIPQGLPTFLTKAHLDRILLYLKDYDPDFHDFVLLALETGARRSELLSLTPDMVNLEQDFIIVRGKGNKERIIPLTSRSKQVLLRHLKRPKLFSKWSPNWVSKKWKEIMDKLGLKYRFHDLRHTTASWLSMHGVPIQLISELLGHANIATTKIYSHLSPDTIRQALENTFVGLHRSTLKLHSPQIKTNENK